MTNVGDSGVVIPDGLGGYIYLNNGTASTGGDTSSMNAFIVFNPDLKDLVLDNDILFSAHVEGGTAPYTYQWGFKAYGSGSYNTEPVGGSVIVAYPSSTYSAGYYQADLTITDSNGLVAKAAVVFYIGTGGGGGGVFSCMIIPRFPVTAGYLTTEMTMQFTSNVTGGNAPYSYDWDYGDSTTHGTQAAVNRVYSTAGIYTVTLTVTDNSSPADTASTTYSIVVSSPGEYGINLSTTQSGSSTSSVLTCTPSEDTPFQVVELLFGSFNQVFILYNVNTSRALTYIIGNERDVTTMVGPASMSITVTNS